MGLCLKESRSLFAEGLLPTAVIIMRDGVIIGRG
jgi:hypothetical protein